MNCEQRCRLEVEQLHQFFQGWFRGELPDTDEAFARFESVIAERFEMIPPSGRIVERASILEAVRGQRGKEPAARIWIENHRHCFTIGNLSQVTYEEWQEMEGVKRGRISSALMETNEDTPNGVHWLHLHETWIGE